MKAESNLDAQALQLNSPSQQRGAQFERMACQYLQKQGLTLLHQNWLAPNVGELDLVMLETGQAWDVLVFVEVKVRAASGYGRAAETVTKAKQRKLVRAAQQFLQDNPRYAEFECRFDVLLYDELVWALSSGNGHDGRSVPETGIVEAETQSEGRVAEWIPEWIQGAFETSGW